MTLKVMYTNMQNYVDYTMMAVLEKNLLVFQACTTNVQGRGYNRASKIIITMIIMLV